MTIRDYFDTYTMLTGLPSTIDYDTFKTRFIAIYGLRQIRGDVPITDISMIAQSVFNSNAQLLTPLFSQNINPLRTWAENGNDSGGENSENNNNTTITYSGSGTADTTENTTTVNGTNNSTQNNSVYAFNSQDKPSPTDTATTTTTTAATNTNTSKNTSSEKNEQTNTTNDKREISRIGEYNKSGFNISDYERTFNTFIAPYDYLIRLISNEICVTAFELFGGV